MLSNPVIENIRERYSCRSFLSDPVSTEMIDALIECGTYAPSGRNAQARFFTVVQSEEAREKAVRSLGKTAPEDFPAQLTWPHQADFCGAPFMLIISGDPAVPFPDISCHLAAENVMLAAQSMGLASVWSTVFTKNMFRDPDSLSYRNDFVPDGYQIYAALFIGYPKSKAPARPERKSGVSCYL